MFFLRHVADIASPCISELRSGTPATRLKTRADADALSYTSNCLSFILFPLSIAFLYFQIPPISQIDVAHLSIGFECFTF